MWSRYGVESSGAPASNLIGAMWGGVVECTSMVTGFRYLLMLAAGFYSLPGLFNVRAVAKFGRFCPLGSDDMMAGWRMPEHGNH